MTFRAVLEKPCRAGRISPDRQCGRCVQSSGFTLIEAMVTVAIIGILAALAAPSFKELLTSQQASNAASNLHIGLIRARSEATKRNARVTLSPNAGGWEHGWKVLNPVDSSVLDAYPAISGLTISGPDSVTYQGSGRVVGSAPAFEVTSTVLSTVKRCVQVDLSGRATVTKLPC